MTDTKPPSVSWADVEEEGNWTPPASVWGNPTSSAPKPADITDPSTAWNGPELSPRSARKRDDNKREVDSHQLPTGPSRNRGGDDDGHRDGQGRGGYNNGPRDGGSRGRDGGGYRDRDEYHGNRDRGYNRDGGRGGDRGDRGRMEGRSDFGDRPPRSRSPKEFPTQPPWNSFMGNLAFEATESEVTRFLKDNDCQVVSVRLIRDKESDRPKGYGYVEYSDADSLRKALSLDGMEFCGRNVRFDIAGPPSSSKSWGDGPRGRGGDRRGDYGDRGGDRRGDYGDRGGDRRGDYGDRGGRDRGDRDRGDRDRGDRGDRDRGEVERDEPRSRPALVIRPRSKEAPPSVPPPAPIAEGKPDPFGGAQPRDELAFQKKKEEEMAQRRQEEAERRKAAAESAPADSAKDSSATAEDSQPATKANAPAGAAVKGDSKGVVDPKEKSWRSKTRDQEADKDSSATRPPRDRRNDNRDRGKDRNDSRDRTQARSDSRDRERPNFGGNKEGGGNSNRGGRYGGNNNNPRRDDRDRRDGEGPKKWERRAPGDSAGGKAGGADHGNNANSTNSNNNKSAAAGRGASAHETKAAAPAPPTNKFSFLADADD